MTCWVTSGSGHAQRTIGLTVEVRISALIRRNMFPFAEVLGFTNRDGCVRRIADLPYHIFDRSSTAFALQGTNSFIYKNSCYQPPKNHYTHARGQIFCTTSLQKQAIFGEMWQKLIAVILLILLSLVAAVYPCLPSTSVFQSVGSGFESLLMRQL